MSIVFYIPDIVDGNLDAGIAEGLNTPREDGDQASLAPSIVHSSTQE